MGQTNKAKEGKRVGITMTLVQDGVREASNAMWDERIQQQHLLNKSLEQ